MRSGSTPARSSTALIAVAASSSTGTSRRLPPKVPTAVRSGATIAARRVVMAVSLISAGRDGRLECCLVVWMGDGDHPPRALCQRQPAQVRDPELRHDDPG